MKINPIKTLFYILLFTILSAGIVYLFNKGTLDAANAPLKIVNPENYTSDVKSQVQIGDIVQIKGTPNLLQQVEQLAPATNGSTNDQDKVIQYYYAGLKEYGYDFVVRLTPGKLVAKQETFTGKVIGLAQTDFGTRIKNSLNKPISFDEAINKDAGQELDQESQNQISDKSKAEFTNATLLVLDGEVVEANQVYLTIIFWTIVLDIFLITLFRKNVFGLNKRKTLITKES